jgi:hypothetical protein
MRFLGIYLRKQIHLVNSEASKPSASAFFNKVSPHKTLCHVH